MSSAARERGAWHAHQVLAVVAQLVVRAARCEPAAQLLRAHAPDGGAAGLLAAVVVASANPHVEVVIVAAAAAAASPCLRPAALAPSVQFGAAKRSGARCTWQPYSLTRRRSETAPRSSSCALRSL